MARGGNPIPKEKIAANLASVRQRMAQAADRASRDAAEIKLVGVTKYSTAEETAALVELGEYDLGESRVQDAESKLTALKALLSGTHFAALRIHLIGHLQTNKAAKAVRLFHTVHSLDSARLARELDKEARKTSNQPLRCLIEINAAQESNKFGLPPSKPMLIELVKECAELNCIRIEGLMCMAPYAENPEPVSRNVFKTVRNLLNEVNLANVYPHPLREISMGMTQDFEIAIEEGATLVRVGSALMS